MLGGIEWIDLERNDREYLEVGIRKIKRALAAAQEHEAGPDLRDLGAISARSARSQLDLDSISTVSARSQLDLHVRATHAAEAHLQRLSLRACTYEYGPSLLSLYVGG